MGHPLFHPTGKPQQWFPGIEPPPHTGNHTYFPYSHHPEGLIRLEWLLYTLVQWDHEIQHTAPPLPPPTQVNTDEQAGGRIPGVSPAYFTASTPEACKLQFSPCSFSLLQTLSNN